MLCIIRYVPPVLLQDIRSSFRTSLNTIQYAAKEFGICPLVQCGGQPALPLGTNDDMGIDTVKMFCPKCNQVYHPPPIRSSSRQGNASGVDGAAFGTTFPHLFLMTFSNLVPDPAESSTYVPRVFGFRVHKSARSLSRAAAVSREDSHSMNGSDQAQAGNRGGSSNLSSKRSGAPVFLLDTSIKRRRRDNTSNNNGAP